MTDENDQNENPKDQEQNNKNSRSEKAVAQIRLLREVKKLSDPDSEWTLPQQLLQEVMANRTVANPDKLPPLTEMVLELKEKIEKQYSEDLEIKQLLLDSIPSMESVRGWVKKDGWDTAVWSKVRVDGLFTPQKRAQVIESLRDRAMDKSDVAAKIWLTLSGDYSEKMEVDNKSADIYREINTVLHKKKTE